MTLRIGPARVHWETQSTTTGAEVGPVVVGYDGEAASVRALTAAATRYRSADIVVVCAVRGRRRAGDGSSVAGYDALKSDAYLLTAAAVTDELLRRGRETARAAGATSVVTRAVVGDPLAVLVGVTAEFRAPTVVLGMSGEHPGTLARALHRKLPDDVDLVVTDGRRDLRATAARTTTRRAPMRGGTVVLHPQPS